MKLRNKKTGEIIEVESCNNVSGCISIYYEEKDGQIGTKDCYTSLAELNEEWEDAPEEPKEYWFLSGRGEVKCIEDENTVFDKDHKSIGNYFESKEEAEKAVEKLKAWKRLKDKGFVFCGWCEDIGFRFTRLGVWQTEVQPDLDLLFGGEE